MKGIIATIILLSVIIAASAYAYRCGLPPLAPIGCKYICICNDQYGYDCEWKLVCK